MARARTQKDSSVNRVFNILRRSLDELGEDEVTEMDIALGTFKLLYACMAASIIAHMDDDRIRRARK